MNKPTFSDFEPPDAVREFVFGEQVEIPVEEKPIAPSMIAKGRRIIIISTILLTVLFLLNDVFTAWLVKVLGG